MSTGAEIKKEEAVGNTFACILDNSGGAVFFDSHGHYSSTTVSFPDKGMLVTEFEEITPALLSQSEWRLDSRAVIPSTWGHEAAKAG